MKPTYIVCAVCLLVISILALMADEDVARSLLKKGDEALQKNDSAKAIELYKKALKEYPNLPEAYLGLGNAYSKTGDKRKARRYLDECIKMIKDMPKPPPALQNLQKEANNRLNNLGKNRQELTGLEKKYIEQSMALAKRILKKDIPLAESILKTVLYLDSANSEAPKLLKEIKESRVFEVWQPLFNGEDLMDWQPQEPSLWKVENNILACDTDQALTNPRRKLTFDKEYKLQIEFRINETYHELGSVGVIIGDKNKTGDLTSVSVFKDTIKLIGFRDSKGKDIKEENIPENFKMSEWNMLVLDVSYGTLKCYLNGKMVLEHRADKDDFFKGGTGIWLQRVKAEIRRMEYLK